jgi:hypothetical protein
MKQQTGHPRAWFAFLFSIVVALVAASLRAAEVVS